MSDIDYLKCVIIDCCSAKPGHIEPCDRSAAKRQMVVIKAIGALVEFSLD